MRHLTLSCAALLGLAGAADASVYQYDLTAELTVNSLYFDYVFGVGTIPDSVPPGLTCQQNAPFEGVDDFNCAGRVNFADDPDAYGFPYLRDRTISATLIFEESEFTASPYDEVRTPECTGDAFVCSYISIGPRDFGSYEANENGFQYGATDGLIYSFQLNSEGLTFQDDSIQDFTVDGVYYQSINGQNVNYRVTSLDITDLSDYPAPIPLPAGGVLLSSAFLALALRRRRGRG
ncbi:hypothetical protein LX81_03447 [Palleronia aestuarii]|uniref:Secreted protein n=1 Tax=Palleronia aestuarii TaxID=568105 RepID=A0A2W7NIB2_9RHOB|nr:hypothetical protein [Palleronia aestuarii]PZX12896.1 hypothetical protein LX81_03447 [Palleronia aestuarii]